MKNYIDFKMNESVVSAPLVSVILLTVNRPQFIEAAIQSVVVQSLSSWELIVLHDGPDLRIAPIVQALALKDSRIRYVHREKMGNIANALNFAIKLSNGCFIAILDDDDAWIDSQKLDLQVNVLVAEQKLVAIGGGAIVVDSEGLEKLRYGRSTNSEECFRRALLANPIIHSTVLYRRSAAELVGLYDENLQGYQDWDFFLKLMRIGRVANLKNHLSTYRVWDGGGSSREVLCNAWSSLRTVMRHRHYFPGFIPALAVSLAYLIFAFIPNFLRRRLYQSFSRFKKEFFSI